MKLRYYFLLILASCFIYSAQAQITSWRDLYKVKKKDTIYGIAMLYGLTVDELKVANPEMAQADYVLKKGDTIFIPFAKEQKPQSKQIAPDIKNTPTVPLRTDVRQRAVKIGIMLPLHNVDGDGQRMIEYYRGLLMGCDSLRRSGISTEIHAWNVNIDADIRQVLLDKSAQQCDIIFGPLYTKQVAALANFCDKYNIKMVIPFSISGNDVETHESIYQVYQPQSVIDQAAVEAFMERFEGDHPVIIDCNDSTSNKAHFISLLRKTLDAKGINYNITNLNNAYEQFEKAFDPAQHNVVVLNSGKGAFMTKAFNKLSLLQSEVADMTLSVFGYNEWLVYERQQKRNFCNLDLYLPSTFYYNSQSINTMQLEQSYKDWFHADMQHRQPRFALTGFDHALFFIKGLHTYGIDFTAERSQALVRPIQTPLRFTKVTPQGGNKNNAFMLIHYTPTGKIQMINY